MAIALKNGYEAHPLAQIFPPINPEDRAKLEKSIGENGQLEEIILFEGKVLDGVNRQDVCLGLGRQPKYYDYMNLPLNMRGESPFQYVMAKNLGRRHLTASQKAIVATEALPYFEAEAKKRKENSHFPSGGRSAPKGANAPVDEFSQDNGRDPADESQDRKGKATAAAAAATGSSTRSVERAKSLKKKNPAAFAEVKKGATTLTKAEQDEAKEAAKKKVLADAYERIEKVSGKAFATKARAGEVLKGRKEVLAYAGLNDSDMAKCRGLVESGMPVARASKYKMTALARSHSIGDLCIRTMQQGGKMSLEVTVQGHTFDIEVKQRKEAPKL